MRMSACAFPKTRKTQNLRRMGKSLKLILKIRHHLCIKFILGSTQRQARVNLNAVQSKLACSKCSTSENTDAQDLSKEHISSKKITAWSYDMHGHAEKCLERPCELGNNATSSAQLVATPCIEDHFLLPADFESKGELPNVCARMVLTCLYLARNGRPDLLWSVIFGKVSH